MHIYTHNNSLKFLKPKNLNRNGQNGPNGQNVNSRSKPLFKRKVFSKDVNLIIIEGASRESLAKHALILNTVLMDMQLLGKFDNIKPIVKNEL